MADYCRSGDEAITHQNQTRYRVVLPELDKMPIILLGRIPLPRLTTYVAVSVFLFACSCCYSRMDVREVIRPVISEPEVHESHAEHFYQDLMAKDDVVPIQSSARNSSNEDGVFDDIKAVKYLVS